MTETMTSAADILPPHEVTDQAKYQQLVTAMQDNGWTGTPVVIYAGYQALTGSHRIAAAEATDTAIPTIDIADLCEQHGVDWDTHLDEHDGDWHEATRWLYSVLPAEVMAHYGLDIH